MLKKLVDLLSMDSNPRLQEWVVTALGNSALGGEEATSKILDSNGILEHLSDLLSRHKDPDLQLAAVRTLSSLTSKGGLGGKNKVANFPGMLQKLVDLLSMDSNPRLQDWAVTALGSSALGGEEATLKILDSSGVLEHLSDLLSRDKDPDLQLAAVWTLSKLTSEGDLDVKNKVANFPGMLKKLVDLLSMDSNPRLQELAMYTLGNIAEGGLVAILNGTDADAEGMKMKLEENMKTKLEGAEGLTEALLGLLAEGISPMTQASAAIALTVISPGEGNEPCLFSSSAYSRRGHANLIMGLDKKALADLDRAEKLEPGNPFTLRHRSTVRARLKDCTGALDDADKVLKVERTGSNLQERGVVKRMMGEWPGALADFNEVLNLKCDDYETLKHRGYVRFLMGDKGGARSDAELAIKVKPSSVDLPTYPQHCLGTTSVEYLEYKLR